MGRASINSGNLENAITYCVQAASLAAETNDPVVHGLALHNKSEAYKELGQYTAAREAAEGSINLLRSSGYQAGEGWAMENLAVTEFFLGDHTRALQLADQALAISRTIASRRLEVSVLTRVGSMRLGMGQAEAAEESFLLAQKIEAEFKDPIPMFEIQVGLAGVALARADSESLKKAGEFLQDLIGEILHEPPTDQSHILPMGLYLMCIRIMKALTDPRADDLIARASWELTARSAKISDHELRAGFLKLHEHQFILAYASTLPDSK
jgi:tetratricopeptide (TPR) repeat protein